LVKWTEKNEKTYFYNFFPIAETLNLCVSPLGNSIICKSF